MKSLDREIARLAIPALGALAADPLVTLIDTAFVGRLGASELAALAVAAAVFGVAFVIFNFLAYGTTPLIGAAVGRGDDRAAAVTAGAAVRIAVVASLFAVVVVQVFATGLLELMGANAETAAAAEPYLRIRALAIPAVLIVMVGHGVFRGHQDTRTPLVVTIGLNVINVVLDPILIFGFGWDLAGAAIATVIAQWSGAIAFAWLALARRRVPVQLSGIAWSDVRPLAAAGGALIVRTSALIAVFTVTTALAARFGTVPVAAHQVAVNIWIFLALVVDALAIAGQAMIGKALESEGPPAARAIAGRLLWFGLLLGLALAVILAVLRTTIPRWLTDDPLVIAGVVSVMWFVVVMQPLNALVFVWDGVALGAQAFGFTAWMMVGAGLVAGIGFVVVQATDAGLVGLWWVLTAWMAVRALAFLVWHQRGPLAPGRDHGAASPAA